MDAARPDVPSQPPPAPALPAPRLVFTPYPDELFLPDHANQPTALGMAYRQWEKEQITTWVSAQPEPRETPTPEALREQRAKYDGFCAELKRMRGYPLLLFRAKTPDERARISGYFAQLYWKTRVLWHRVLRLHDFPTEILVNILDILLDTNLEHYRIVLSSVNRQWRQIVVSMPRVWQSLWLNDAAPHTVSKSFMARAQGLPLDLRIGERRGDFARPEKPALSPEAMHSILDTVFPRIAQIRKLVVVLKEWPASLAFFERARACPLVPSQLEHFEFHRTQAGYMPLEDVRTRTEDGKNLLLFGGNAKNLRWLTLDGVHMDWAAPLENLDTLDLRRQPLSAMPSWGRLVEVLRASPRIRELTFDGCSPSFPAENFHIHEHRIALSYLRTLNLGGMAVPFLLRLIYLFSAPRLTELILRNYEENTDWSNVFRMMTGLHPLLRILQFNNVRLPSTPETTKAMARFFMAVKNVEVLRVFQVQESFLNFLLEDGRYYLKEATAAVMTAEERQAIEAEHPHPVRMLPALKAVIFDSIPPDAMVRLADARLTLGVPVPQIYANQPFFYSRSPEEHATFKRIGVRPARIVMGEMATPEEQAVWRDVEGPHAVWLRSSRV